MTNYSRYLNHLEVRVRRIAASLFVLLSCVIASLPVHAQRIELEVADITLGVYLLLPTSVDEHNGKSPLVVLMPGGSGEEALARDLYYWLGMELSERGWAVAIPVSPDGRSFRGSNNALIPELIDVLQQREEIAQGATLLAGISNGGMSALEIAAAAQREYLGVLAVPALVPNNLDMSALSGLPIYLRIGDQDEMGWASRLQETQSALEDAGAIVDADLVFMAPHMFGMDWENLDPWLQALR